MKAGRPKTDITKPARRSRAISQSTATEGVKRKGGRDGSKTKRGLLASIIAHPLLTPDDRKAISEAHQDGLTVADLAALCVFELRLALALHESGSLDSKDLMIALNKAGSHVAASAQLGQSGNGAGASITVTFDAAKAPKSERPEAQPRTPTHIELGDVIDVH